MYIPEYCSFCGSKRSVRHTVKTPLFRRQKKGRLHHGTAPQRRLFTSNSSRQTQNMKFGRCGSGFLGVKWSITGAVALARTRNFYGRHWVSESLHSHGVMRPSRVPWYPQKIEMGIDAGYGFFGAVLDEIGVKECFGESELKWVEASLISRE